MLCRSCEVRQLAICAALEDEDLHRLDAIVTHIHVDIGETLFYEGDEAGHVFTVASGTLRLHKMLPDGRRQITGFVLPGDFLGLSGRDGFSYTAEAVTEAGICRFPRRELEALFDEFPKLEKELLWKARDELVAAQEQMLLLGRKMPAEKIASFLLGLSRRAERWEMPSDPVLLVHLGLVAVLMIIFPFSKLLHVAGVFFSPSRNQVDDARDKRHLAPWAAKLDAE